MDTLTLSPRTPWAGDNMWLMILFGTLLDERRDVSARRIKRTYSLSAAAARRVRRFGSGGAVDTYGEVGVMIWDRFDVDVRHLSRAI